MKNNDNERSRNPGGYNRYGEYRGYSSDSRKRTGTPETASKRSSHKSSKIPTGRKKSPGAVKKKRKGKKYVVKKRFYVICLAVVLILAVGLFFGVKGVIGLFDGGNDKSETKIEQSQDKGDNKRVDMPGDGVQPAIMLPPVSPDGKEPAPQEPDSTEKNIRDAIMSNWYIAPLGQTRTYIEQEFGSLTRGEDWAGGIYYHKKFPESMYITYTGKVGEDKLPAADACCDSIEIALKKIIEYEAFVPDKSLWGKVHKNKTGHGWSNYFYSVLIRDGINLIVYCEKDGTVDPETHITVRRVYN